MAALNAAKSFKMFHASCSSATAESPLTCARYSIMDYSCTFNIFVSLNNFSSVKM